MAKFDHKGDGELENKAETSVDGEKRVYGIENVETFGERD